MASSVDLFVCLTVIQHFPDAAYAERIIGLAADVLVPGGVALLQTRVGMRPPSDKPYKATWGSHTLIGAAEFRCMVEDAGFTVKYEEHGKGWANSYYYLIGRI